MVDMSHIDRAHPDAYSHVLLSLRATVQLNCASQLSPLKLSKWEIAEEAIADWVAKHEPGAVPMPSIFGFQWKTLFLPNGTVLRTVFGGKKHHCRVEDDQLRYEGKPMSPNEFANLPGGTRRNAWKVIWVLLPETRTWQLAADLRPARPVRATRTRARKSGTAPLASDAPVTKPAQSEGPSPVCCRCGLPPADAGPEQAVAQRPARPTDAEAAAPVAPEPLAAPDAQQPSADASAAWRAGPPAVQQKQPVAKQTHPHQYDYQVINSAHQLELDHQNERINLDRTRTDIIERRRRTACCGCQLSVEALLL